MLEVEHDARHCVGREVTLHLDGSDECLTLGSKRICKRIVFVSTDVADIQLSMSACKPQLTSVRMVAMTKRFALSRMRQRLTFHAGGDVSDVVSPHALYREYRQHLQQQEQLDTYTPKSSRLMSSEESKPLAGSVYLYTAGRIKASFDPSLLAAVDRAVRLGASIEWIDKVADASALPYSESVVSSEPTSNECCTHGFVMPVATGVQYRVDVIEALLRGAEDSIQLIYADHDHVDQSGNYRQPELKPEWNPELLLNTNYIGHPYLMRAAWITQQLPPLSEAHLLESALVQAALTLSADEVVRLPQVLASLPMKNATSAEAFPKRDGLQWSDVVKQQLSSLEPQVHVEQGLLPQSARIFWPLPAEHPTVDIIIPTRDNCAVLRNCVESVLTRTDYSRYHIHLMDNDSCESDTLSYYALLAEEQRVSVIAYPGEFNFSAINNAAVKQTQASIIVLLNNDTQVINRNWLDELVRQAVRPRVGCVGAKLYYSNGMIQHGGVITGITGIAGHAHRYQSRDADGYCGRLKQSQNFSAVTAACLAVRRETFEQVGGLDEQDLGVAWNDVDFCLKVQAAGFSNIWTPYAELFHHEGFSRGADDNKQKVLRARREFLVMQNRWQLDQRIDPAYHPDLTRDREDFSLAA